MRQAMEVVAEGGLVAYPTDSGYALGCALGNKAGRDRIIEIRRLDERHHFTLMCADFAQMGLYVDMSNAVFRALKAATPGPYTFILRATPEVPRKLAHAKKHTVGVRISGDVLVQAMLRELGEPMLSSTLILPGQEAPLALCWPLLRLPTAC